METSQVIGVIGSASKNYNRQLSSKNYLDINFGIDYRPANRLASKVVTISYYYENISVTDFGQ